jgi:squalene-hopene/tetraprenyl-beta-curcumene cyclase
MIKLPITLVAIASSLAIAAPLDTDYKKRARSIADGAIEYLRDQQDGSIGGWRHNTDGPNFPAITGLVVTGMLLDARIDQNDESVKQGVEYILTFVSEDGGIHDGMLQSYNTSICLSALAEVRLPDSARAIIGGQGFLRSLQYDDGFAGSPESAGFNEPVPIEHPYYGGIGYGKHGRPDLSNLGYFMQAMHDTGVSSEDESMQKALKFLERVQMLDEVNDMSYADESEQGGFIYATVPNIDSIDGRAGQSMAGTIVESDDEGKQITRLRAYGSMSYVGFKSLLFADLSTDDPRVEHARRWIGANFTVDENPGMGDQGLYYYYCSMARALSAWGEDSIDGVDWREAMIDRLETLQTSDGSFEIRHDRWMESDPVLITAYALIAIEHILND